MSKRFVAFDIEHDETTPHFPSLALAWIGFLAPDLGPGLAKPAPETSDRESEPHSGVLRFGIHRGRSGPWQPYASPLHP